MRVLLFSTALRNLAPVALLALGAAAQGPGAPPEVGWAPDGKVLVASNNLLARFDLDSGEEELLDTAGGAFTFHPLGTSVALARGNVVEIRSYPELAPEVQVWPPDGAVATALGWSPDAKTLAVGADNGHVSLWDLETGEMLADVATPVHGPVERLRYAAGGTRLLATLEGGRAVLVDTEEPARSYELTLPAPGPEETTEQEAIVDINPSGRRVLATRVQGERSDILLLDDTGQEIWRRSGFAMGFTPDGSGVLALSWPFRVVGLYHTSDSTAVRTFEPPHEVHLLYFVRQSPDGKYLLGVGEDRRTQVLVLWDFATGELKAVHR